MEIRKLTPEVKKEVLEHLRGRSAGGASDIEAIVAGIVEDVRKRGDAAVFELTKRFDKADITAENIRVTKKEMEAAYEAVDPALLEVIRRALENIRTYHEKQKRSSWFLR